MNDCFNDFLFEHTPYLLVENNVVTGIGELLLKQLGYELVEIIGKNELDILDLFFGGQTSCQLKKRTGSHLVFTKNKEAIIFTIQICDNVSSHQRLYLFQKKEMLYIKEDLNTINQLIKNSPFGMAFFSIPDVVLLNANQSWLNRLDAPYNNKEHSIGKPISEIITGWKGSTFEKVWKIILKSGKACHLPEYCYKGLKKGLSYWNISLTPLFDKDKLAYFVEITFDVTESVMNRNKIKIQKDQLFKQFQQFETVVENMSDALFIVYPDYSIAALNQEAHLIKYMFNNFEYNITPVNIRYYDSNSNEIPYKELPVFKIIKGDTYKAYRVTVTSHGDTYHFSISGRPVFDNHKNIYFSIICIRDVTIQVNNDYYVLKVEKEKKEYLERVIAIKDDFLTLISHEFKTPLTVINTAIQALELFCGNELSEKAKSYIKTINQNSLRQFRLVSNLLDITRGTADQIRFHKRNIDIVFLTSLITDSVKAYAAQKDLDISFYTDVDEKIIHVDDEKYERILLNILSNAIKFTPKGKSVKVRLFVEGGFVNIAVKDEGVGIPKDKLNVIFERFEQVDSSLSRQTEGSGIGLFLVKMFVEKMGGDISVASTPYKGTTFLVRFPDVTGEFEEAEVDYSEDENRRIISMANIEFSDIYFSK